MCLKRWSGDWKTVASPSWQVDLVLSQKTHAKKILSLSLTATWDL